MKRDWLWDRKITLQQAQNILTNPSDKWNGQRIDFWQAIHQKLMEKYRQKGISIIKEPENIPVNEFCAIIGKNLKELREQNNLTQSQLAEKLEISQQLISRIEKGRENISILTLKKIVEHLGKRLEIKFL